MFSFRTLVVIPLLAASLSDGQGQPPSGTSFPKHYFSVNPMNILLFQQAGLTYEYRPADADEASLFFIALKPVYKYMHIDSTQQTAWSHPDDYYVYRKMDDKVNIYGGFVDFGYKWYIRHFFVNVELGVGILAVNHDMTISAEWLSYSHEYYYHPPKAESTHESHLTINFTISFGGAL